MSCVCPFVRPVLHDGHKVRVASSRARPNPGRVELEDGLRLDPVRGLRIQRRVETRASGLHISAELRGYVREGDCTKQASSRPFAASGASDDHRYLLSSDTIEARRCRFATVVAANPHAVNAEDSPPST